MAKLATPLDVERARSDTPGLQAGAGGTGAFLNSAGAALMPQTVLDTQLRHLQREAMIGGYGAAQEAGSGTQTTSRVGAVYRSIATLIGAAPSEIALVENATVAWQLAFYAVAAGFQPGDRILTRDLHLLLGSPPALARCRSLPHVVASDHEPVVAVFSL